MEISEIKQGDILFIWGNGPIEEAIEWVTKGPSHCALFLDEHTLAEAQGGRESGEALLADYLNTGDRLEVWRDETLTDEERKKIVDYAKDHFGIKYDYFAIFLELARFELNMPISYYHESKRRICSSFVNDCAKSVGRNWSNTPYTPAPIDLLRGGKLTLKGALRNAK